MQFRRPRREIDGILLLDKPVGISSNQALQRAKQLFSATKAGHTGSLDPLATGVLPLCFGEATKLCGVLLESDKRYVATVRVGERTTTGDAEGEVIERSEAAALTRETLEAMLPAFLGTISQVPPMYSALKHQGRPLYALAREGIKVERQARQVRILSMSLHDFAPDRFVLEVHCSKGTYIRTLVEDLGCSLGQCAHLLALRRTAVTPFEGRRIFDFSALEDAAAQSQEALDALLIAPAEGMAHWPSVIVDEAGAVALAQGRPVRIDGAPRGCAVAVLDGSGALLGLADTDEASTVAPRRWLQRPKSPGSPRL